MNGTHASMIPSHTIRMLAALLVVFGCLALSARAQSGPTASRPGDLQIGGGLSLGTSSYNFNKSKLTGGAVYATFDQHDHWGLETNFRQTSPSDDSTVYERTFQIGPRLYATDGRFKPYAKFLVGRGVYNFSGNDANIAYNIYTFGGGADYSLTRSFNLRIDYERQSWLGFPIQNLQPNLVTIGLALHFHQ
jgi:hypothetical protein